MGEHADHEALFARVHQTVIGAIVDVVGEDFFEEMEIGLESSFAEDVELESTEMLRLAEQLMETYQDDVDFLQWFADMDLADIIDLTLGELVTFIVTSIEASDTAEP